MSGLNPENALKKVWSELDPDIGEMMQKNVDRELGKFTPAWAMMPDPFLTPLMLQLVRELRKGNSLTKILKSDAKSSKPAK
jgi:hypothetical protein